MPTTRRDFLRWLGAGAAATVGAGLVRGQQRRPNVIFILADDLGYFDTHVYGSRYYDTPNIDRLAQSCLLFTDAYAANPLCSPTRASLQTGKYPARLGITTPAGHLKPLPPDAVILPETGPPTVRVLTPQSRRHLPLEEYTLGEAFRDAGYRTAFIGKWHLGQPEEYWPDHQGYEVNIAGGGYPGPPSYHSPYRIKSISDGPPGEYLTDRLGVEAEKYIEAHRHEPFMMCWWQYAVHAPYQDKEEIRRLYLDRKDPRGFQGNPIMAAMVRSLDDAVGRILDTLDRTGLADDTIVVFFSDNGGNMYDKVPIGDGTMTPTNNAPLRSGKGAVYEGGCREPLLIRWPGVTKPGTRCADVVSSVDLYPTLLEMVGIKPQPDQILDGESLVPILKGTGQLQREAIFCHMPHKVGAAHGLELNMPSTWVRRGDWKLIRFYDTDEVFPNEFELYNLRDDIGEQHNVAAAHPALVKELDALIDGFLKDTGAMVPKLNPAYDPSALAEVQGWRSGGTSGLKQAADGLQLVSTGGDPQLWRRDAPAAEGKLVVRFRIKSDSKGPGQLFWTDGKRRRFGPIARLNFQPEHNREWHEIAVEIDAQGALGSLRIDPCIGTGTVTFAWIRLEQPDGKVLSEWRFDGAKPAE